MIDDLLETRYHRVSDAAKDFLDETNRDQNMNFQSLSFTMPSSKMQKHLKDLATKIRFLKFTRAKRNIEAGNYVEVHD